MAGDLPMTPLSQKETIAILGFRRRFPDPIFRSIIPSASIKLIADRLLLSRACFPLGFTIVKLNKK
jgi:hypothetical protein